MNLAAESFVVLAKIREISGLSQSWTTLLSWGVPMLTPQEKLDTT
jgi:hypothetical protein